MSIATTGAPSNNPSTTQPRVRPANARRPRWTSIVGLGLKAKLTSRAARLTDTAYWARNTAAIQRAQLRRLLTTAAQTEFGRAHDFAALATLRDPEIVDAYRKAVPPADYYAFRTFIARMRENAEPDVLWPGVVRDFAQTSGTTAGDKFIPVSREMLKSNYRAAEDIFATAMRFGISLPAITAGRCLFLGGSSDVAVSPKGIRTGDLSGLVVPLIRWPISQIYSPGPDVALLSHWPTKIEKMAQLCLEQDIRMVNGMPSWGLVLFQRVLELARERGMKADCLRDVWPNFQLFVHGGVKYTPFDERLRQTYSASPSEDIPYRIELYPASEGFIAIQDTRHDPGLRLLTDIGNFYEFIPLEEVDKPDARAFTADQAEKGQRYVVTMTTCAGLWRYIIGDVVEFDTLPAPLDARRSGEGPARLRIVGRHRHFINAFGENLIVEHIENAVAAAARQTSRTIGEFTAAPVYPSPGVRAGLELVVECARPFSTQELAAFADAFDRAIKQQNVDYTTKRTDDLAMAAPTITHVPIGTFHAWMASRGKLGGQHKCPRCANNRDIVDAVLSFASAGVRG